MATPQPRPVVIGIIVMDDNEAVNIGGILGVLGACSKQNIQKLPSFNPIWLDKLQSQELDEILGSQLKEFAVSRALDITFVYIGSGSIVPGVSVKRSNLCIVSDADCPHLDYLVLGGPSLSDFDTPYSKGIRNFVKKKNLLGIFTAGSGTMWMASCGLLYDRPATRAKTSPHEPKWSVGAKWKAVRWNNSDWNIEYFPPNNKVSTARGAATGLIMAIQWVKEVCGGRIAVTVANQFDLDLTGTDINVSSEAKHREALFGMLSTNGFEQLPISFFTQPSQNTTSMQENMSRAPVAIMTHPEPSAGNFAGYSGPRPLTPSAAGKSSSTLQGVPRESVEQDPSTDQRQVETVDTTSSLPSLPNNSQGQQFGTHVFPLSKLVAPYNPQGQQFGTQRDLFPDISRRYVPPPELRFGAQGIPTSHPNHGRTFMQTSAFMQNGAHQQPPWSHFGPRSSTSSTPDVQRGRDHLYSNRVLNEFANQTPPQTLPPRHLPPQTSSVLAPSEMMGASEMDTNDMMDFPENQTSDHGNSSTPGSGDYGDLLGG